MKLMRFLLGLVIGAGVALLVAPKSGRDLRQQLAGGASGKLLGAAPDEYPQPEPMGEWAGPATAVAEAPQVVEDEPWAVEPVVEELVVEEASEPPAPFRRGTTRPRLPRPTICAHASTRRARRSRTSWRSRSPMPRPGMPTRQPPSPTTPSWTR